MTSQQQLLMDQASESLKAAQLLHEAGHHGFAASRAYYAMFYAAEALLMSQGLSFSKHAGVIAAFGQHFVKTGSVPAELHRNLIRAMEVRHAGDYGGPATVMPQDATEQIENARAFVDHIVHVLLGTK